METASFGSRGCILQGKVALCPATPCIDSMGTATHMDDGALKNSFFFRYRAKELWRGGILCDFFERKKGRRKIRRSAWSFVRLNSWKWISPFFLFGREMKRIDVPFKNLLSRQEPGAPSKLRITTSLGVMDISPRKKEELAMIYGVSEGLVNRVEIIHRFSRYSILTFPRRRHEIYFNTTMHCVVHYSRLSR